MLTALVVSPLLLPN
ncbi:BgTH12-03259 [Blumeria graminis f. sp. triticale]|uniref:BgTH12-03259 n=1 Tax=Blumeria graminis f. sp. triticale TaxID=1689686 RepID=A0A9W4D3U8_BLUGR|nr:BgTH12-03259 [Blumeria graminis f. sp. triticale]